VTRAPACCAAALVALLTAASPGAPRAEGHPVPPRPAAAPRAPIWRAPVAAPVVEQPDSVSPGAQRDPTQTAAIAGPVPGASAATTRLTGMVSADGTLAGPEGQETVTASSKHSGKGEKLTFFVS
jgi:hypothetical protein